MIPPLSPLRVRAVVDRPIRPDGAYVLYWMTAQRRPSWNAALDHAVRHARALGRPLLVFEPLDADHRWASARFHAFVIDGMRANHAAFARAGVTYLPWVAATRDAGRGLLAALAAEACLVVTDEVPAFRGPELLARAAARVPARIEAVDGNGALPLRLADREHRRAVDFRRFVHKTFATGAPAWPSADPLARPGLAGARVPPSVLARWPAADLDALAAPGGLDALPIDASIRRVVGKPGGHVEGTRRLTAFLAHLDRYPERNHPDADAASGLSPWLHFGHVGGAQVVAAVLDAAGFDPGRMDRAFFSKQEGAWGLPAGAEAFLEEILTWRELAHHTAFRHPVDHARYDGLPDWARASLEAHAADPREALYDLETLADARTADPLWNAAQRELRETGVMHNYLRMLWGKRVLAWTATPREAFDVLVELNNRYALDGRDPNSYGGIAWVLGRYDRPWGPERPIYGMIRYMTSDSTRRKLKLDRWLARWGR
jgi:deoxyribodipyrimidine photo-lyase